MRRYLYLVLALMVLVAAIGAACDGAGPSAPDATATPTMSETPVATPTALADPMPATAEAPAATPLDTVYETLLGIIPDTPETRMGVFIHDYTLVRQMFDIPLPGPGDDEDSLEAYYDYYPPLAKWGEIHPSTMEDVFFSPFNPDRSIMAENLQYLAFDVRNIDQILVTQTLGGPDPSEDVVRGRFDPQATDAALSACSDCPEPSREEHRGIPYYSWGEDYAINFDMKFAPPAFDQLGRGGRIAVLDEYVFRTNGTSEMKALIDAHLNEAPSLADVEEIRLLAGGMSKLRAYTMFLSDKVQLWGLSELAKRSLQEDAPQADIEAMEQKLVESGPLLRPYDAYGVGAAKDEDGAYTALVLVHADDASAEENVGLLRRRIEEGSSVWYVITWSDFIDVDTLEIKAEGRLLLARLRGDLAAISLAWVYQHDFLIFHE